MVVITEISISGRYAGVREELEAAADGAIDRHPRDQS
jgi:hypothetical protein